MAFEQDVVEVTTLGGIEGVEPEVVEDEQVDGDQSAHLALGLWSRREARSCLCTPSLRTSRTL